jgi:ATP-binding cassette subfamily E protein 1
MRVAVMDYDLCKPSKCHIECVNFCPVNRSGTIAIEISDKAKGKPVIYEETCIGCGICVRKCPFEAISIVNVPDQYEREVLHRHGVNGFKLYGIPTPKRGKILGLIGKNGSGKTTILRILSGEIVPNLGEVEHEASRDKVLSKFKGREIYDYFNQLYFKKLKVVHKIQYIELVGRVLKGRVSELMKRADERGRLDELKSMLGMETFWEKEVSTLSGGELQKLLIAAALAKEADVYVFDEPSYLDVRERLNMALAIREMTKDKFVVVVEHDLIVLDYLTDLVHIIYGEPAVYGKVSRPYATRVGINYLIEGYLPAENMKIRDQRIQFNLRELDQLQQKGQPMLFWTNMNVELGDFVLAVNEGNAGRGEVIGILGPNGIGKTTFVRTIVGEVKPSSGMVYPEGLRLSYKPQRIAPIYHGKVKDFLSSVGQDVLSSSSWFYEEVIRKLNLHRLIESEVSTLSGGELQKLLIAAALAKEADVYVFDEPSSYLDVEERYVVAKAIKRVTLERRSVTFVVEHDLALHDYISDSLIVFDGRPGRNGSASPPLPRREGMNLFLKKVNVTFRRDPDTGRPRVNKPGSYLDRMQKEKGQYYFTEIVRETE